MPLEDGLILGTAQLARPYGIVARQQMLSAQDQLRIIRRAETLGVVALDTSPIYGEAEKTIGASATALEVHTKCHPRLPVEESISLSKMALKRDILDVVYLHERLSDGEYVQARLRSLVARLSFDVREVGVSIYDMEEFFEALRVPEVSVIQVPVSILDQRFVDIELLDRAANLGKKVFARSVFLQGLLLTETTRIPRSLGGLRPYLTQVDKVSQELGISRLELALSYVKSVARFSGIIVGTSSVLELEQVITAYSSSPSPESLDLIDGIVGAPWNLVDPRKW